MWLLVGFDITSLKEQCVEICLAVGENNCCDEIDVISCLACHLKTSEARACMIYPDAKGCGRFSVLHPVFELGSEQHFSFVTLSIDLIPK